MPCNHGEIIESKCIEQIFWFPDILGKICPISFDDFSLITGPKTTYCIYLGRQSYILLKYINILIVGPEITTLLKGS